MGKFISPKQCRQRWFNHICNEINKREWSKSQDLQLLKLSIQMGKKWSAIARTLNTHRTEHMVKNRFNSIINKVRRKKVQNEESLTLKAIAFIEKKKDISSEQCEQKQKQQQGGCGVLNQIKQNSNQGEDYNISVLPEGDLKDIKQYVSKREKGFIAFNPDDGIYQNQCLETVPSFSMTPSVKAISPGFTTHFYNFEGFVRHNQKRREDGSSLFSPAPPCYSPATNYLSSFSPSFDMRSIIDKNKQKQEKYVSKDIQTPTIPSELSCEYKNIMYNLKKGEQ